MVGSFVISFPSLASSRSLRSPRKTWRRSCTRVRFTPDSRHGADITACRKRADAVEKVGATLTTRNNRIAQAGFLNRSCAFDARLESILLEDPLKIFFDSIGQERLISK